MWKRNLYVAWFAQVLSLSGFGFAFPFLPWYALGLLSSSSFIGISIGPLLGGVFSEWFGYRTSFTIGSAILATGFALVLLLIREAPDADEDDEDGPDGEKVGAPSGVAGRPPLRTLFTVTVVSTLVMMLILRFVRALPVPFLPLYVQQLRGGIEGSASITGFISAARGAATALAAVTITRLGDRHPKLLVVSLLLAVAGVLSLPIAFLPSLGLFAVLIVIATFFLGGIEPLLQAEISARVPANRRGVLFGVQTTVGNMGWFVAPLVGSWISIEFGINIVFFALALSLFPAAVTALIVHRRAPRAGNARRAA